MSSRQYGSRQNSLSPPYRWDPYREMDEINERFSRLARAFFGDTRGPGAAGNWPLPVPPVDVEETDDSYVVEIDLPNVDPQELNLEMLGEELHLWGRRSDREKEGVVRRQDRPSGDFEFMVDLPGDVDANRVEATYDKGVLRVTVWKAEDAQPRRIEIRTDEGQKQAAQGSPRADGQEDTTATERSRGSKTEKSSTRASGT